MITETSEIISFDSPIKAEIVTRDDLEMVKGKILNLLKEVGAHF
jgi:hypothetical protein